ncbi:hypothetical protein ISCGN_008366 [Ixodes scapularis]
MIPVKSFNFSLEHRLMEWKFIQKNMPWAIIFIIGGGSTLTEIIQRSQLFSVIFDKSASAALGPTGNLLVSVLVTSLVTEFTNADVTMFQVLDLAEKKQESGSTSTLFYALPMALTNNFAFVLPSSEAWNAIVFEIGGLSVGDMVVPGLFMKMTTLVLGMIAFFTSGIILFNITDELYSNYSSVEYENLGTLQTTATLTLR